MLVQTVGKKARIAINWLKLTPNLGIFSTHHEICMLFFAQLYSDQMASVLRSTEILECKPIICSPHYLKYMLIASEFTVVSAQNDGSKLSRQLTNERQR